MQLVSMSCFQTCLRLLCCLSNEYNEIQSSHPTPTDESFELTIIGDQVALKIITDLWPLFLTRYPLIYSFSSFHQAHETSKMMRQTLPANLYVEFTFMHAYHFTTPGEASLYNQQVLRNEGVLHV